VGETRFALARARWHRPADRVQALALARAARADYAQVKAGTKAATEIDAWLKTRIAHR